MSQLRKKIYDVLKLQFPDAGTAVMLAENLEPLMESLLVEELSDQREIQGWQAESIVELRTALANAQGVAPAAPAGTAQGLEAQVGKLLADGAGTKRIIAFIQVRDAERERVLREMLQGLCEQAEAMIDELPDGEYKGLGGLRLMLKDARVLLAQQREPKV